MDHRELTVLLLLWSSELCAEDTQSSVFPGDIRLVGGTSRCAGRLEMKLKGVWETAYKPHARFRPRNVIYDEVTGTFVEEQQEYEWNPTSAPEVCRRLDCGSLVSLQTIEGHSGCVYLQVYGDNPELASSKLEINCSESIRLVNGKSLCSGRLEVRSNQSDQSAQSWSSVCEDDFDLQDAEVVCRELGCGAPSVLQGALYGDVEAPVWTKEFQCGGHESALLDCDSSDSDRKTCSPGKAVGLTCSEPGGVRLTGGASRCDGTLEMKQQGEWKPVDAEMSLRLAGTVCGELDCGSAVSTRRRWEPSHREVWALQFDCDASSVMTCFTRRTLSSVFPEITCSDSQTARLVNGTSLCSGRLEVRPNQSNKSNKSDQSWSSVCEDDFDLQDAEVVCRELGCGAPSVLQGALYGDVEAPVWTKEFQCGGHESALLDCDSSALSRDTCSPVGLTCSDPEYIRLLGEASRCAGLLEMKNHGEWRPVAPLAQDMNDFYSENLNTLGTVACRELDCGSAVPNNYMWIGVHSPRPVWTINSSCVKSTSALKECVTTHQTGGARLDVTCSDLLAQPNISLSPSTDGVSKAKQQELQVLMGSNFTITCSVEPQYPGGFFQLVFTTSNTAQDYTLPAVNHSAHFLFSAADPAHRGEYRCVYHLHFSYYNFTSESQPLYLTVSASLTELFIRLVVLLLGMMLLITTAVCFTSKASRIQNPGREKNTEIKDYVFGGSRSEGPLDEEAGPF